MAMGAIPSTVAVVTADLIGSRRYPREQRQDLNRVLKESFDAAEHLYPQAVLTPLGFKIVQGDEFQMVLKKPADAYPFLFFMRVFLANTNLNPRPNFRASIGIGEIAIIEGTTPYAMDGVAFHASRDGLDRLGQDKAGRSRLTALVTGDGKKDVWFDIVLMYQDLLEKKWSLAQREAIFWRMQLQTYEAIGKKIDIAQQNVQKRLQAAHWEEFSRGMEFIKEAIFTL